MNLIPNRAPKPPAPTETPSESDAATRARFLAVVTAIELERGEDVMSTQDCAAIEKDPVLCAEWLRKFDAGEADQKKRVERSSEAAKAEAQAASAKNRARILNGALILGLGAATRR